MKKFAYTAIAAAAVLALSACGKSDKASEGAEAENVEVPADETMSEADASASPVAEASGAPSAEASAAASAPAATASAAVDKAAAAAEKKMN